MKQLIIVISGKKQSGKNTLSNFILGTFLKRTKQIDDFEITDKGLLKVFGVAVMTRNEFGVFIEAPVIISEGEFNKFKGFKDAKLYSFAYPLKRFCMDVFGLEYDQCYGTDEDKNSITKCTWANVSRDIKKKYGKKTERMMAREVMQVFGTDMVRSMYNDAWPIATYNLIEDEKMKLAIITDARFPNEIDIGKGYGGKSIRLMRCKHEDYHPSETALDDYRGFDVVLDNRTTNIPQQNDMVLPMIDLWFKKMEI